MTFQRESGLAPGPASLNRADDAVNGELTRGARQGRITSYRAVRTRIANE